MAGRKQRTYMGMPLAEYCELRRRPCQECGAPPPADPSLGNLPQRDKTVLCLPCAQAAYDASAKPCAVPGCRAPRATRVMGTGADETLLCGKHANAAKRGCTATLFTGPIPLTRANILAAATR